MKMNGLPIDIENRERFRRILQPWLWMSRIVAVHLGKFDWQDRDAVKTYVREKLGRRGGHTFLTELSPLPRRGLNDPRRTDLFDASEPEIATSIVLRRLRIRDLFEKNRPRLVVCYGSKRKAFSDLLGISTLPAYEGKIEKTEDGRVLFLPFLGNGQFPKSLGLSLIQDRLFGAEPT
jgi:hypothetical protein